MNHPTKIFLNATPWDIRSRNTDWRVVRYAMPRISEFHPELEFIPQRSPMVAAAANFTTIRSAIGRRVGLPVSLGPQITNRLSAAELERSRADVIYGWTFPLNAGRVPVVWWHAVLDPRMQMAFGASEQAIQRDIALKAPLFARSAKVVVTTEAEVRRHQETFPAVADRFVDVPFFSPHISACERTALERHRDADPVRILFVGNNAWRKGLDQLFAAFLALPAELQRRASLTVISNFDRSNIAVPQHESIRIIRGAPSAEVLAEMCRSHIFVNVARFESYGVVFHEAMSQGLACIAPDWEVQSELFDHGRAGILAECNAEQLRAALQRLITDEDLRYAFAVAGWQRFQQRYAPRVVAAKFAQLFHQVSAAKLVGADGV
jgi:glycosyltransferase involved in cell wall biosynthesis